MKNKIQQIIIQALSKCSFKNISNKEIKIEDSRDEQFGDYACNIAMLLSKQAKINPRELAQKIIDQLPQSHLIDKVEVAGPGFINFYLTDEAFQNVVVDILQADDKFGCNNQGKGKKVIIEFLSCNPTGPLHVGHGRGASYGASLSNVLAANGYDVHREYYVNDSGRQMDILTISIWLRYLSLCNYKVIFPNNGYKGDYVINIAKALRMVHGDRLCRDVSCLYDELPEDNEENKDHVIDQLVVRTKMLLEENTYQLIFDFGLESILVDIKNDLKEFGVTFDKWFHESSLTGDIKKGVQQLTEKGHTYEKEGALWFNATKFGDEKDRVLIRKDGRTTYFAADVGYHLNKYQRGYDMILDIFGADHHGYIPRINAFLNALNQDTKKFHVLLVQFAILYRGKKKVPMSTRAGQFVTLRALREEVGNDAARFFYVMRKAGQHLDFDLKLAKSKSNENPVYYIQYAYARVCSVFRQSQEKQIRWNQSEGLNRLNLLSAGHEKALLRTLSRYPEVIKIAANHYEPHLIAHYLQQLASDFHAYYNTKQFLVNDSNLRHARLCLITAVRIVLRNGLKLLGVTAPESM